MSAISNGNQSVEAIADTSSDSGVLADVSVDYGSQADTSSDSRASVNSRGTMVTVWSVNSDNVGQARAPIKEGNWEFISDGALYIGSYKETIESTEGEKLKLEFRDGSRYAVLKKKCLKTARPVTITRPPDDE